MILFVKSAATLLFCISLYTHLFSTKSIVFLCLRRYNLLQIDHRNDRKKFAQAWLTITATL